jgi:hypothetical protein
MLIVTKICSVFANNILQQNSCTHFLFPHIHNYMHSSFKLWQLNYFSNISEDRRVTSLNDINYNYRTLGTQTARLKIFYETKSTKWFTRSTKMYWEKNSFLSAVTSYMFRHFTKPIISLNHYKTKPIKVISMWHDLTSQHSCYCLLLSHTNNYHTWYLAVTLNWCVIWDYFYTLIL